MASDSILFQPLLARLNRHLGLRSRDWPLLLLMLGHVFIALTLMISLRSLNSGLFLSAFPATVYPWYFLADSCLSFVLSLAYGNLSGGRISRRQETYGFLVIYAAVLFGGRLLLFQSGSWVHFALPVACESLSSLLMIQAWALYADCVDSRKARRIFPLIGLGGTCGGIFGGWLASSLVHDLGTENLLFVEILLLGLLGLGARQLLRRSNDTEQKIEQRFSEDSEQQLNLWQRSREVVISVLANKLLFRVLVILVCVRVASTIMDYQLQLQLKSQLAQNGITSSMGTYYAITSFVTLLIQLTLENRIINKQGVVWGMGSTPLTLGLGLGGFLLAPSLISAFAAKFFEQITRNSLFKTAVELVYLPFDASLRRRLKVMVNGILSLTTVPLASLTIMLFSRQLPLLVLIALGFAAVGILFSVLLQGPYTRKLHDSLMRRHLLEEPDSGQHQLDLPAEAIEARLTRGDIGMILFALELLRNSDVRIETGKLLPLLFHENPYVREGALIVLGRDAGGGGLQVVVDLLIREREPRVRTACFRALRQLGDESQVELALPYLGDAHLPVRSECLLFLFTKGGIEGILAAAEALKRMTESGQPAQLAAAAYVIGEIGIRYFRSDFHALLTQPDANVRRAALDAAAAGLPLDLMPDLMPLLADRQLARSARQALAGLPAEEVVPAALAMLHARGDDVTLQVELVRLIGSFQHALAVDALMDLLAEPEIRIKYQVLQSLISLRRLEAYDVEPYTEKIFAQLRREFYFGFHYYYLLTMIRKDPGDIVRSRFLQSEIKAKIRFVQEMIFRLLGLLHSTEEIYKAFLNFRSESAHFRALSLEVLSYTLQGSQLDLVLCFLDDLPNENKVEKARDYHLLNEASGERWWESPVIQIDPWLLQLALWSRLPEDVPSEETDMFELLDKMYLLKQTPVFENFTAEQLYPVAAAAEELYVPAQTVILRQGQPGDAFYILSAGTVAVERSGVRVTLLGEKECFGELEVLNADPSLAAIRTLSDCELLRISREDFIDLVEDHPDFSRGLLEVLSERLAAHVLKLSATQPLGTGSLWSEPGGRKA